MTKWKVIGYDGIEYVSADEWENERGMLVFYNRTEDDEKRVVKAFASGTWKTVERFEVNY